MIYLNGDSVNIGHFPDGTVLMKQIPHSISKDKPSANICWLFENNEELTVLFYLTRHLQSHGIAEIELDMPYLPNARQDRVKSNEDVFTLKYFSEIINMLGFKSVAVLDPHSYVSEALIDRITIKSPKPYIDLAVQKIGANDLLMFYPDEGAMKRYSGMIDRPFAFGIKKRDWATGQIMGLDVSGMTELVKGGTVLIVDDISSRGGTFYHSAKKLRELGAKNIYLYISHCENTILDGEVLKGDLIQKVFTTNSIFTAQHHKIEVFNYDRYQPNAAYRLL